MAIAIAERQ